MTTSYPESILIISHHGDLAGSLDYFEEYLISEQKLRVNKVSHPLNAHSKLKSILIKDDRKKEYSRYGPHTLNLLIDYIWSVLFGIKLGDNIIVGANNFDTLAALTIKRIKFWKKIKVYYFGSDYSDIRFNNSLLNKIYLDIEKIVDRNADLVISNTERAEVKRISHGLTKARSLIIPNGVHLKTSTFNKKDIRTDYFAYVGSVNNEHGLPDIIDKIHDFITKLVLIGSGTEWKKTIELCEHYGLEIETYEKQNHEFVIDYLTRFNGFGLAPYNVSKSYTFYSSPLKISEYIACGVPVITSDATEIAGIIKRDKLGIVYKDISSFDFHNALQHFQSEGFEQKAKDFYNKFNRSTLYSRVPLHTNEK